MPKILVIDDKKDNLTSISALLKILIPGCDVLTAQSGPEGIKMTKAELPDTILLDIKMPEMDGFEVCTQLKSIEEIKYIPIIMLTAIKKDSKVLVKSLELGADTFLTKPIDGSELAAQVKVALRIKKAEDRLRQEKDLLKEAVQEKTHALQKHLESIERLVEKRTSELKKVNENLKKEIKEHERTEKALMDSEQELNIRNRISEIFLTVPDDKMYREVLQVVLDAAESPYGTFAYINEHGDRVVPTLTRDIWVECQVQDIDSVFPKERWTGIWGRCLINKETISSNGPFRVPEGHVPMTRAMAVPIIHQGEVVGNFMVGNKASDYGKKDRELLETIANHLAPILHARLQRERHEAERKMMQEKLAKKAEETIIEINRALKTVSECNKAIAHAREESDLMYDICRIIVEIGGYRLAWVGFAEHNQEKNVRPMAQAGFEEGYLDTVKVTWDDTARGRGPTGSAIRTMEPSIAKNILTNPDYHPWRADAIKRGYESGLAIPLVADNQCIGALNIYASEPNAFDTDEVKLLSEVADGLVYGIKSIRTQTERKRIEAEKLALEVQLRQQQKLESIGTLAGGVAHEINNPINGIMNYAQLIFDRLDKESPLTEFAKEIIHETKRVSTIVGNLLTFSRQEKQTYSPAGIADIVEATLSLIRTVMRRDQITLEVEVPDDLPKIKCRSQQIQQVLMNLVTNARDALNERYPKYDENKTIKVYSNLFEKEGKPWIRTTVEDRGTGIDPDTQERMFDPFFTTKPRETGTGLGLSISYGIVQDHHGELHAESEPGQYTRFHLDLLVDNGWEL